MTSAQSAVLEIAIIAAVADNGVIGRDDLPWRLPEDLRRFKALTLGHPVIMGRRTFESMGRPLPERRNIVLSTTPGYEALGTDVYRALDDALASIGGGLVFILG
ncbi:MAG: diacylglycerol kinase, partial [Gemmatimonadetes bacterium]|nr:diacylglycerol kinase [Gemmatimonadota bacterium]